MSQGFTKGTPIDTDPTLSLNSDIVVPSQKAVKSYLTANYQPTLVSGTNIKTINGNTLLGSGDLTIGGGGITVGTTPVTSGTDTRVFFQQGGVVQQDANFTFDNTLKRLTLKAIGATASDIPFIVRNSADTYNILSCYGNELTIIGRNESTEPRLLINRAGSTRMVLGGTTDLNIQFPSSGMGQINSGAQGLDIISSSGDIRTRNSSTFTVLKGNFFGIGAATPAARLDIRAQGALSTDIAFRVRNSADSFNMFDCQGNSITNIRLSNNASPSGTGLNLLGINEDTIFRATAGNTSGSNKIGFESFSHNNGLKAGLFIDYGGSLGSSSAGFITYQGNARMNFANFSNNTNGWAFMHTTGSTVALANTVFAIYPTNAQAGGGTIALGTTLGTTISSLPNATYGKNTFFIGNGTSPSTTGADAFGVYSADIVAGNAAPHFRTENGDIIKLFRGAALTASDGTLANAVTRIAELEARLQANGLLT